MYVWTCHVLYIPLYVRIYFSLTKTLKFMYVCMYTCFRIVLDDKFINNRVQVDENFSIANIAAKITVSLYIHEQLLKVYPIIKSYVCMYVCVYQEEYSNAVNVMYSDSNSTSGFVLRIRIFLPEGKRSVYIHSYIHTYMLLFYALNNGLTRNDPAGANMVAVRGGGAEGTLKSYIHTYIHKHIHTHINTYIHTYIHT